MKTKRWVSALFVPMLVAVLCWTSTVQARHSDWQRQEVNWRITGRGSIKAIDYPSGKPLPILTRQDGHRHGPLTEKILSGKSSSELTSLSVESAAPVIATVIDSPPIAGFVPWVAIAVTNERSEEFEVDAVPEASVVGNYLTSNPETDYAIGILDTGASAHIMGNAAATRAGLFDHIPSLITSSFVEILGVTGSVNVWVSQPIGLFIDGLGAIEPDGLILYDSWMVGESNVSICVGDEVESPDLPTVVGAPLSVYFTAVFYNDQQVAIIRDGNEFTGPDILFYNNDDPCIPDYSNTIYLELRPTGSVVQYFPNLFVDWDDPEWGAPMSPSTIGEYGLSQSLFFTSRTDLAHGDITSQQKKFMFDTGAQLTVISESQAAELELDLADPNFEVEIMGVTGDFIIAPGFYIDSLKISATPKWLSFTHVPVIVLNIDSPEGGILEGIIGMNLFGDMNFYLCGGGFTSQPCIKFEFLPPRLTGDITPLSGDGLVNLLDLAAFAQAWLTTPTSPDWNSRADMIADAIIDFRDFAVLAEHWLETATP
jgi:hypothetical protein